MFEMDLAWDRPAHSGPQPTRHILRVRLRPLAQSAGATALPLRLAVALDTSGSMAGAKLEAAKAACRAVLALLRPEDRFSLAAFGDTLQPLGVTRTDLALEWLEQALPAEPGVLRVALLITDGHATNAQGRPLPHHVPLLAQATQLGDRGVPLHPVGLGSAADFNAGFLAELSDRGRGAFLYADTPRTLEPQLRARLDRAQATAVAAPQLHLISLIPGVQIDAACRLRPEFLPLALPEEAAERVLALPALAGDAPTDLLLSVIVPPPAFGEPLGARDVLELRLRAGDAETCGVAAMISTASYREAQQLADDVDQDRLAWELNTYSTALTRSTDTHRTSALLSDILYTARRTGRAALAEQAARELDSLQRTGALNPHASAKLLTSTRELGGR